jgi:hypothetical protein
MKRIALGIVTAMLILWCGGCATHYHRVGNDTVTLYLKNAEARSVSFASSLDGFALHAAHRIGRNLWEISVPAAGEFKYFYIIDGNPYVPPCKYREKDDFGSENCIFMP